MVYRMAHTRSKLHNFIEDTSDPILALGARLAVIRSESLKTQAQFADALGISGRAYHLYECGKRGMPATTLIKVAELYDVNLNWLMRGIGGTKIEDHKDEIQEFIVSLYAYLDRTETKLRNEGLAAIISRWVARLIEGDKPSLDEIHHQIDILRTQP